MTGAGGSGSAGEVGAAGATGASGTGGAGALDDAALAAVLLPLVGGAGNVESVEACASRLRFVLRDPALRDEPAVRAVPGVAMVLTQSGQFQVVLGARAVPVRREVHALLAR
jgi:phosphotransferase system IIB component